MNCVCKNWVSKDVVLVQVVGHHENCEHFNDTVIRAFRERDWLAEALDTSKKNWVLRAESLHKELKDAKAENERLREAAKILLDALDHNNGVWVNDVAEKPLRDALGQE